MEKLTKQFKQAAAFLRPRGRVGKLRAGLAACMAVAVFAAIPLFQKEPVSYGLYAVLCLAAAVLFILPSFLKRNRQKVVYQLLVFATSAGICIYCVEAMAMNSVFDISRGALFFTWLVIFGAYLGVSLLFSRAWAGVLLVNTVLLLFGVVNHYVLLFRGVAFVPSDILAAGTAADVASGYTFTFRWEFCFVVAAFALSMAASTRENLAPRGLKKRLPLLACGCAVLLACYYGTTHVAVYSRFGVQMDSWSPLVSSRQNGFALNFMVYLGAMRYEKPPGYSDDAVLQMAAAYDMPAAETKQTDEMPDVWMVMSEAFADLNNLGNLPLEEDYLPFLHSLAGKGDAYLGRLVVPVIGGGTCNTEFEAITGFSKVFAPAQGSPLRELVQGDAPSLARQFGELGYTSEALHLANPQNWNRDKAYPFLGFSTFFSMETNPSGTFDALRSLATDAATYELLEKAGADAPQDKPYFNFTITMQNHGPFHNKKYVQQTRWLPAGMEYPEAEQYFDIMKVSDDALAELYDTVQKRERPTLVVFFGDHLPRVEEELFSHALGRNRSTLTLEENLPMYETPVAIFANFDVDYSVLPEMFSANYMPVVITELAGLPQTPFERFLSGAMEQLPVFSALGFVDAQGAYYTDLTGTPYEALKGEYANWQYAGLMRYGQTKDAFS